MKTTNHTLMEQLRITSLEIDRRKQYLNFTDEDANTLASIRPLIEENINKIVDAFYKNVLSFDKMDRIIGDSDTLSRLKNHQRRYILTLFDGQYDEEYVYSRLRVGLVHKRIGLDPKLYISVMHHLSRI